VSQTERVLVLVRGSRDAELTQELLARAGFECMVCRGVDELCSAIVEGAGAALLAEEVLAPAVVERIATTLRHQPPWSDFPLILFGAVDGRTDLVRVLGNVTFLDRPVRARSMVAAVTGAIRSRRRQYEGRRAIESRDTFLAMLGHELRNPLGAIRLAMAMIDARTPAEARTKEHDIIDRQGKHLTRLVDDLLDVARITHGKVVLKTARLNLVDAVRDAFEAHEARARTHGLKFSLRVAISKVCVDGDRQRLEQVFANLLTNAIKYTPRDGAIIVSVDEEGDDAVVRVDDSGVGISPEMLPRVFDVFAQANRSLDRTEGGIGLGLALVQSIVTLHHGRVEAHSAGAGRGSSFVVRFPRVAGEIAAAEPASSTAAANGAKRIVVVEDSSDIRELLVAILELAGHAVSSAEDGPRGLDAILTSTPDIAFVDLGLPGFDGFELARRARAQGSTARLVAVTGYGQYEDRQHAAAAGFDDHLTKPVVAEDLQRAMQRMDAGNFR